MNTPDLLSALLPVADALEELGVPWQLGGSVASSVLGVARTTLDVDLVADLREEQVEAFAGKLGDAFYCEVEALRTAVRRRASFNVIHLDSMIKVDVFLTKDRPFERSSFSRIRREVLDSREFPVSTAEDIILHKLVWYRDGGEVSDRQWKDLLGVLEVQDAALDEEYLDLWAGELGLADLLEQARREVREA